MDQTHSRVQELLDRQAILECVQRYARGIDRDDLDLVASCYHSDAIDDHGFYVGSGRGLGEWAIAGHQDQVSGQHHITNHLVEFDGDTAHSESYFITVFRRSTGAIGDTVDRLRGQASTVDSASATRSDPVGIGSGRYLDRFERRDGEWRIAARVCVVETLVAAEAAPMEAIARSFAPFSRDRSDLSYSRPLTTSRRSAEDSHPDLASARAD